MNTKIYSQKDNDMKSIFSIFLLLGLVVITGCSSDSNEDNARCMKDKECAAYLKCLESKGAVAECTSMFNPDFLELMDVGDDEAGDAGYGDTDMGYTTVPSAPLNNYAQRYAQTKIDEINQCVYEINNESGCAGLFIMVAMGEGVLDPAQVYNHILLPTKHLWYGMPANHMARQAREFIMKNARNKQITFKDHDVCTAIYALLATESTTPGDLSNIENNKDWGDKACSGAGAIRQFK